MYIIAMIYSSAESQGSQNKLNRQSFSHNLWTTALIQKRICSKKKLDYNQYQKH